MTPIEALAAQQRSDVAGRSGGIDLDENSLFVFGSESPAFGFGNDLGVGAGTRFGADVGCLPTPFGLASLDL